MFRIGPRNGLLWIWYGAFRFRKRREYLTNWRNTKFLWKTLLHELNSFFLFLTFWLVIIVYLCFLFSILLPAFLLIISFPSACFFSVYPFLPGASLLQYIQLTVFPIRTVVSKRVNTVKVFVRNKIKSVLWIFRCHRAYHWQIRLLPCDVWCKLGILHSTSYAVSPVVTTLLRFAVRAGITARLTTPLRFYDPFSPALFLPPSFGKG